MVPNLDRLSILLQDAKHRLDSCRVALAKAQNSIADGERMESDILINIEVLKDAPIIAIAEYQASRKELAHVRQGLIRLRSYKLDREKEIATAEKAHARAHEDYQAAAFQDQHKILPFRRKNG